MPFEPSERMSNHLYLETGNASVYHRRSVTEVYGTKTKHVVERLRQELAEKDFKVKVSLLMNILSLIRMFCFYRDCARRNSVCYSSASQKFQIYLKSCKGKARSTER